MSPTVHVPASAYRSVASTPVNGEPTPTVQRTTVPSPSHPNEPVEDSPLSDSDDVSGPDALDVVSLGSVALVGDEVDVWLPPMVEPDPPVSDPEPSAPPLPSVAVCPSPCS